MKVWTISEQLRNEWDTIAAQIKDSVTKGFEFLESKGIKATGVAETGECYWSGEVPDFCKLDGKYVTPKKNTKVGKQFLKEWKEVVPEHTAWGWALNKYRAKDWNTHRNFQVDTIGGVEYIVIYEGYDFSSAGCELIEI